MPSKLGNFMMESGVRIAPVYGATEFGVLTHVSHNKGDETDWEYMAFSDRCKIRWEPQGDGTFEAQFLVCI